MGLTLPVSKACVVALDLSMWTVFDSVKTSVLAMISRFAENTYPGAGDVIVKLLTSPIGEIVRQIEGYERAQKKGGDIAHDVYNLVHGFVKSKQLEKKAQDNDKLDDIAKSYCPSNPKVNILEV